VPTKLRAALADGAIMSITIAEAPTTSKRIRFIIDLLTGS
jgi:hypothetical protein